MITEPSANSYTLYVEALDQEGRGVAHHEGKTIFIPGALPGEHIVAEPTQIKARFDKAKLLKHLTYSHERTAAHCPHFEICGGCSLQHLNFAAQVAIKQRVLEDALLHIGRLKPDVIYPAISGPAWHYRHRTRLTVRYVAENNVLVGFHQKANSHVANLTRCSVLPLHVSHLLPKLHTLIGDLSMPARVPQIEFAIGQDADGASLTLLILRTLYQLDEPDRALLATFARSHKLHIYLQPGDQRHLLPLISDVPPVSYTLPDYQLRMEFHPTGFTQINPLMNQVLVRRAVTLLDVKSTDTVHDLFCGLGNFTLPLALTSHKVVGFEVEATLIEQARHNAKKNGFGQNKKNSVSYMQANLMAKDPRALAHFWAADKVLLDPPRDGALALIRALYKTRPSRIVYISCNPSTLARDTAILVHEKGYSLLGAGIVNMFPHTAHTEAMACFELP